MFSFDPSWKHKETEDSLMVLKGWIKKEYWKRIGQWHFLQIPVFLGDALVFVFFFPFFSIWVFFHNHSWIRGVQMKGEGISLSPHYHFHLLYRHLDISRAITGESSPLHIVSSRTRTGNLWFPSASLFNKWTSQNFLEVLHVFFFSIIKKRKTFL